MVELKVRIGQKGQIVIPKIFRESFKIYPQQEIIIKAEKDGVLITKQEDDIVEKLREIAIKVNMKEKLDQKHLRKLREEQYEKRARKAGIIFRG